MFSLITGALFPLTVVKTRMMALDGAPSGLSGAVATAREVVRADGVRGLYRGFGTVLFGAIPARIMYLGALESSKAGVARALHRWSALPEAAVASSASFVAGGAASLAGQLVIVPVDVVSQRLMIAGGPSINGWTLARRIVAQEGFRGLYRGFGASVATFAPSNAIWWSAYGGWQAFLWERWDGGVSGASAPRTESEILGVQIVAGVLTGCTSASLTTPLDVVKTRLQTREAGPGVTWRATAAELLRAEGAAGFFRGVAPRMVSSSIWGTAMVTTYEFLKRLCVLDVDAVGEGG